MFYDNMITRNKVVFSSFEHLIQCCIVQKSSFSYISRKSIFIQINEILHFVLSYFQTYFSLQIVDTIFIVYVFYLYFVTRFKCFILNIAMLSKYKRVCAVQYLTVVLCILHQPKMHLDPG